MVKKLTENKGVVNVKKNVVVIWVVVAVIVIGALLWYSSLGPKRNQADAIDFNSSWEKIAEVAKGQKVNFYMWSGDAQINKFIDNYLAQRLKKQYEITLNRVPITDIKDTINKLVVEKQAAKKVGSIDLIWINGENFKAAKQNGLLWGPIAKLIPNVDKYLRDQTLEYDFGEPIENLEVTYGEAQFVLIYNRARQIGPFGSMAELEELVKKHPGQFTYPAPPDFTGSAFVRQVIYETTGGYQQYLKPFDQAKVAKQLKPAWDFLNRLEPYLWRQGKTYPESIGKLNQLYSAGEVAFTMGYHPLTAENKIKEGSFPKSSQTFLLDQGTLFNNHYLTIPFNAPQKAAALVAINEIISPAVQIAKAQPANWGDGHILDLEKLSVAEREALQKINFGEASLPVEILAQHRVPEIRAEYVNFIEAEWQKNVAQQ